MPVVPWNRTIEPASCGGPGFAVLNEMRCHTKLASLISNFFCLSVCEVTIVSVFGQLTSAVELTTAIGFYIYFIFDK